MTNFLSFDSHIGIVVEKAGLHGSVEHIKDIHRSPSLIDVFVQIRLHSDNYIEQFNAPDAGKKLAVANISGLNSR